MVREGLALPVTTTYRLPVPISTSPLITGTALGSTAAWMEAPVANSCFPAHDTGRYVSVRQGACGSYRRTCRSRHCGHHAHGIWTVAHLPGRMRTYRVCYPGPL